jgi:hypothetical protein
VIPVTRHLANRDVRGSHLLPGNSGARVVHAARILVDVKGLDA